MEGEGAMTMRTLSLIASVFFLVSFTNCAKDKDKGGGDAGTAAASILASSLTCQNKTHILKAEEGFSSLLEQAKFDFSSSGKTAALNFEIKAGENFAKLNWGSLQSQTDSSVIYQAPSFVPEFKTIEVSASNGEASASCSVHLLPPEYQGVPDDSKTRGVKAEFFRFSAPPACDSNSGFPDTGKGIFNNKSVARDVNFNTFLSPNNTLVGLTTLTNYYVARLKGELTIDEDATYVFTIPDQNNLSRCRRFYFNDKLAIDGISNTPNGASVVGVTQSPNLSLKPGKYPFTVEYYHGTSNQYELKLQWAKVTGTNRTGALFKTIPWTQFDSPSAPGSVAGQAPSAKASFVKIDTTTQGNWNGVYGIAGRKIVSGPNDSADPSYAQVSVKDAYEYTWAYGTNDVRAVNLPNDGTRVAGTWYQSDPFYFDINISGTAQREVALYMLDWDSNGRKQRVEVIDEKTGVSLDSRDISSFNSGKYVVYNISGHVRIYVSNLVSGSNAVVAGLFFGP